MITPQRRARSVDSHEIKVMAAIIASGIAHHHGMDDDGLASRALDIAMAISRQAEARERLEAHADPETAPVPTSE